MTFNLNNATKGSIYKFSYPCKENKYVCYPLIGKFPPGIFLLEIYGAEGGKIENNNGGKGGFSKGILSLHHYVDAYLYIGAQGKTTSNELNSSTERTFGGGGSATQSPNVHSYSSSGGGASDIRLFKNDLYHRVIVAGGGGGTGNFNTEYSKGGDGGGSKGGSLLVFLNQNLPITLEKEVNKKDLKNILDKVVMMLEMDVVGVVVGTEDKEDMDTITQVEVDQDLYITSLIKKLQKKLDLIFLNQSFSH